MPDPLTDPTDIRRYSNALRLMPFAAVVLDLTIPGGLGGPEVLKRLRGMDPGVRAVVASGYSAEPVLGDFRKYGFAAALEKPFGVRELGEAVARALREGSGQ